MHLLSPGDAYTAGVNGVFGDMQLLVVQELTECKERYGKPDALYRVKRIAASNPLGKNYKVAAEEIRWGSSIMARMGTGGVKVGQFKDPAGPYNDATLVR